MDLDVISVEHKDKKNTQKLTIKIEIGLKPAEKAVIEEYLGFLSDFVLTIEVLSLDGDLLKVFFLKPKKCFFLTKISQGTFLEQFDPTNKVIKYMRFMKELPIFQIEMCHYQSLFDSNIKRFKQYTEQGWQEIITFLITVVISVLILIYAEIDMLDPGAGGEKVLVKAVKHDGNVFK